MKKPAIMEYIAEKTSICEKCIDMIAKGLYNGYKAGMMHINVEKVVYFIYIAACCHNY
jgi:hypothetical protein